MPGVALSRVVESGPDGDDLAAGAWERLEALRDPRSRRGASLSAALLVAVAVCAFTAADNDRLTVAGLWPGPCSGRGRRRPGGPSGPGVRGYRARRAARQAKTLARSRLRAVAVDGKTFHGRARRHPWSRSALLVPSRDLPPAGGGNLVDAPGADPASRYLRPGNR